MAGFVVWVYTWVSKLPIADGVMARVIQEFSYPGVNRAVPRYFNSNTFRQGKEICLIRCGTAGTRLTMSTEWIARRTSLLQGWRCPVVIMQGYDSRTQPREFYENAREYIPNAKAVEVMYLKGGHFWTLEDPQGTTAAVRRMLQLAQK